ncbi:MAG: AfsR/SARP family transcriptional regulator [Mycobacterium leprae]
MAELAELQICLFGSFQVCWEFVPISPSAWGDPRALKLLKLSLVRRPDGVPPDEARRLIGGGLTAEELQKLVEQVGRVIQPAARLYQSDTGHIWFEASADCWIDVDAFLGHSQAGLAAAARGDMLQAIMSFQEADALYQGELLEESHDEWLWPARHQLQEAYTATLEHLAEGHAVLSRYQDAVGFCYKALAHNPTHEATYQRMMVYYYYLGDMAGAEQAYITCQETLRDAGRHVSDETVRLWERISTGRQAI